MERINMKTLIAIIILTIPLTPTPCEDTFAGDLWEVMTEDQRNLFTFAHVHAMDLAVYTMYVIMEGSLENPPLETLSLIEYQLDWAGLTVGKITKGVDRFYQNPDNRTVHVTVAIQLIANALRKELEKHEKSIQANLP
jgi:hypothetical protein